MSGPNSNAHQLVLPEVLDITQVNELRADLMMALGQTEIHLLANEVVRVDTAGLQLLVALVQEAQRRQLRLIIDSPAPVLQDAASRLGLADLLAPVMIAAAPS